MSTKIKKQDFDFTSSGHGHYRVTYHSRTTGKKWTTITNDMPLIDITKNESDPKKKNLEQLKKICKNT